MASFSLIITIIALLSVDSAAGKHSDRRCDRSAPANPRLRRAHQALHAWKRAIHSDPSNLTADWLGPAVCAYTGVFCAPVAGECAVAGIDLNGGDIAGFLPPEMGLLAELALIHLNSNRFCGMLPAAMGKLSLLYELDLSNNRFVGPFPGVVLSLPALNFLDLRFNEFEGAVPPELLARKIDAVFLNNNRFTDFGIAGNSSSAAATASVVVFANNKFSGQLPPGIVRLAHTLEELVLINSSLSGCLPQEVGFLYKLKVFDVSFNEFVGPVPYSLAGLYQLELLNLAQNRFSGTLPEGLCALHNLLNFTVSDNFLCEEDALCRNNNLTAFDDRRNCIPHRRFQRSTSDCHALNCAT